ncbi:hypothetical protein [Pseudoduganella albidiflava]|uniref:HEPN domain-containing protein n=1 Tax=Pseudoduganella albidiflava TaxID=321983 RepID=A0A411X2S1_9BURK|nr:hypothetical protein [Pseudoduganella albidiflava]QBI03277.1 hypothetical protein EYF70_22450 [Pseudoduganella albidiflava]GGY68157.1 hypothetical protein GCM10007387_57930 [Pseudoduganella albidiflava]
MEQPDESSQAKLQYAERVSNALEWFKHARSLLAAARSTRERAAVLIDHFERSDLENVASMLYGFSLENLFKAQWILKKFGPPDREGWAPVAEFPKELKTHNLAHLAKLVDPRLPDEFSALFYFLTEAATWSGRYPCTLFPEDGGAQARWPALNDQAEEVFKRFSREFTAFA